MCWWFPPPWGCSTGFMATPRTLGHELRFTLYLWYARPALSIGLSMRPPPAMMPTIARHLVVVVVEGQAGVNTHTTGSSLPASQVTYLLFTDFLAPEGRRILVLPESSLWATTVT